MSLRAELHVVRAGFDLHADVEAAPGQVLGVIGPNGAGKSTLLRSLAGLVPVRRGRVTVAGTVWADVEPEAGRRVELATQQRRLGVVFQDYRLFPHLTVLDNVGFAPRARGASRRQARARAARELDRFDLVDLAGRRPGGLSGGQAQRVALARALAGDPQLLLLDEPLAALDARTRTQVRAELRRYLTGFGGPSVLVTHDPVEAMVLADRLVVLEAGRVVQQGSPGDVARRPATQYVARLVGLNLYPGRLVDTRSGRVEIDSGGTLFAAGADPDADSDDAFPVRATPAPRPGQRVLVRLAPSAIAVFDHRPDASSVRNVWSGHVDSIELLADRVRLAIRGRPDALVDITPAALAELRLDVGQQVWLTAKATEATAYPQA